MSTLRNLLLISSSRVHGFNYLEVAEEEIQDLLLSKDVSTVLFVPYASKKHDEYLNMVRPVLNDMGFNVEGIHQQENPVQAVETAQAVFIGGGNTFLLLKTLYEQNLIQPIRKRVLEHGVPYIGSSAGTNVATRSINTTNDMPIVFPPSFEALKLVPFNINPHYLETDLKSTHKGETRDQRLNEYLEFGEDVGPVLGLKEGSMLRVLGDKAVLKGITNAKLFKPGCDPQDFEVNSDLSFLLNDN